MLFTIFKKITRTYLKHEILRLDEARAFRKAQFTGSLRCRAPHLRKAITKYRWKRSHEIGSNYRDGRLKMSASPEFIEYVRELFTPLGDLQDGKFFGGFAFKSGAKQFAMIMDNTLYFCVNEQTRPKYEAIGMEPFSYATKKGRVQVKKYFFVPEDLFDDQEKLISWANEAIQSAYSG